MPAPSRSSAATRPLRTGEPPPPCASSWRMGVSTGPWGCQLEPRPAAVRADIIPSLLDAVLAISGVPLLCPPSLPFYVPVVTSLSRPLSHPLSHFLSCLLSRPHSRPLHISCPASFHFSIHVLYHVPDHVPGSARCTWRSIGDPRRQSSRALDGGRGRPTGKRQVPVALPRLDVADRGSGCRA